MLSSLLGQKRPTYTKGERFYSFDKGYNLNLAGDIKDGDIVDANAKRYAIKPIDFNEMSPIPKVVVEVGDNVLAGDALFYDKKRPEIMYCSPVSGEVIEVNRGAKRSISEVVVLSDSQIKYKQFNRPSLSGSRKELVAFLAGSGCWSMINERPFDVVPDLDTVPRDIFITTFDTGPFAMDYNLVVAGRENDFQKGLEVLSKLTTGSVHLGLDGRGEKPSSAFTDAKGVNKNYFSGPHPAGNVGVQIHHVSPIRSGDAIWTMQVHEVITLGRLFNDGIYDASRIVKVAGSVLEKPQYLRTYQGVNAGELLAGNISEENIRIISGNVLSGKRTTPEGYLNFRDNLVSTLEEGNKYELFGWLLPLALRPSISGTFPNAFFKNLEYTGNTNTHGEKRAFVVTGQYESVLPMDIYVQHLMKAILTGDFERMEGLGLTELTEEDVALAEFVCTSKNPLQSILRDGLEMMRKQL